MVSEGNQEGRSFQGSSQDMGSVGNLEDMALLQSTLDREWEDNQRDRSYQDSNQGRGKLDILQGILCLHSRLDTVSEGIQ